MLTEGTVSFTQERGSVLYFQDGNTANLTWSYTVDNRTAELKRIIWRMFNKTDRSYVLLLLEEKDGTVKYNPIAPPAYGKERITKEGQASLVIKNITFKDSTTFECTLDLEKAADLQNSVELIVTGK